MILVGEKAEINDLIKKNLVRPTENHEVWVVALRDIENNLIEIPMIIKDTDEYNEENPDINLEAPEEDVSPKTIDQWYEVFKDEFPSNDKYGPFPKTRAMKKDPGDKGLKRFRDLVNKEGMTPESIIEAMKYEVWWRKKASTTNNLLKYMPALQPWLNDASNISNQLEEMADDEGYKEYKIIIENQGYEQNEQGRARLG